VSLTVKICGLTNPGDARAAVEAGADFLGFVFDPESPRCVGLTAAEWIRTVDGAPTVGVFRDQDPSLVRRLQEDAGLDLVQLHGHENPELCAELGGPGKVIKAIPVTGTVDWGLVTAYAQVARVLFDAGSRRGGGSGRTFDWRLLAGAPHGLAFWLAGGLTPDNVAGAIGTVRPVGVDVASGVEAAVGRKDAGKMGAFVAAVRGATEGYEGFKR
jgi:phosphoribosylanthranilate isomerase